MKAKNPNIKAYNKEYRQKNKERIKQYNKDYYKRVVKVKRQHEQQKEKS